MRFFLTYSMPLTLVYDLTEPAKSNPYNLILPVSGGITFVNWGSGDIPVTNPNPTHSYPIAIHSSMNVNRMVCETLHPNHVIAKIHKRSGKEQAFILSTLERLLKQKKFNAYRSAVSTL